MTTLRRARSMAQRLAARTAYAAGFSERGLAGGAVIFRYHSVTTDLRTAARYVSPAVSMLERDFDRHMAFVKKHFDCVPLSTVVQRLSSLPQRRERPLAAVTFDDGYADNFHVAWPVLKAHQIPATIFLIGEVYAHQRVPWLVRLRTMLSGGPSETVVQTLPAGAAASATLDREAVMRLWTQRLCQLDPESREHGLRDLGRRLGVPEPSATLSQIMLSPAQIAAMRADGVAFGSHTETHPNLGSRPVDEAQREIQESSRSLHGHLNVKPTLFAYPNPGSLPAHATRELAELVRRSGYTAAVTSYEGVLTEAAPIFQLPRIGVSRSFAPIHLLAWKVARAQWASRRAMVS